MKFYRIEKDGVGPYRHINSPFNDDESEYKEKHPSFRSDKFIKCNLIKTPGTIKMGDFDLEDFYFGFSSKKQLHNWFSEYYKRLIYEGFRILKYEFKAKDFDNELLNYIVYEKQMLLSRDIKYKIEPKDVTNEFI